jgi:hypothetical protein
MKTILIYYIVFIKRASFHLCVRILETNDKKTVETTTKEGETANERQEAEHEGKR